MQEVRNHELIRYFKEETKSLLKEETWGFLPRYHLPDKDYLPYIHMKLKMAFESGMPEHDCIVSLFNKYKKMENGEWLVRHVLIKGVVMRLVLIMDPPATKKHENLTLNRIPLLLRKEEMSAAKKEVDKQLSKIKTKMEPLRTWRDKKLAHTDLGNTIWEDEDANFAMEYGAYSWIGEKPREDTVALAYKDRYQKTKEHLKLLNNHNATGCLDVEIRKCEAWLKKLGKVYDPVAGKRKELYDDINESTISEIIDMISGLLDYVGELCKQRYGEAFEPILQESSNATTP